MKYYKQVLSIVVFSLFIIPQITLASWWNPFTWSVFNKPKLPTIFTPASPTSPIVNVATTTKITSTTITITTKKPIITQLVKLSNAQIIAKIKPAIVYIETDSKEGSGMIISSDGYVLTNAHVVAGVSTATITLSTNKQYTASVVGRDENIDIAILKIDASNLPTVIFADSDSVNQGDNIFALGFPFGIKGDVSFTAGVISRTLTDSSGTYFETTAEIHPGNSGGPLVNQYGQVIGINTASYGDSINNIQVGETIKLAIPINIANKIVPALEAGRDVVKSTQSSTSTNTETPPVTARTGNVCANIETDFFSSINAVSTTVNQLSTLSQLIQTTIKTANQALQNGSSLSAAYQQYVSADKPMNDETTEINTNIGEININTSYEDNDNLKTIQDDLVSASSYYNTYYKAVRSAYAAASSAYVYDNIAEEEFIDTVDNAKTTLNQGNAEYTNLSNLFSTIENEDAAVKAKNNCDTSSLQIYSDIQDKVAINPQFTCAYDGYTSTLDVDMCEAYRTATPNQRSNWKIISRPK